MAQDLVYVWNVCDFIWVSRWQHVVNAEEHFNNIFTILRKNYKQHQPLVFMLSPSQQHCHINLSHYSQGKISYSPLSQMDTAFDQILIFQSSKVNWLNPLKCWEFYTNGINGFYKIFLSKTKQWLKMQLNQRGIQRMRRSLLRCRHSYWPTSQLKWVSFYLMCWKLLSVYLLC